MSQIVTLTMNPAVDRLLSIDHVSPDVKLRCDSVRRDPGGGGVNVTRGIRNLGGDSLAIFTCGGYTGDAYRELLEIEEMPNIPVPIEAAIREHVMVQERATGRNYRFGEPGPELTEDEAQACLDAIADIDPAPDYLVLSGSLPGGVGDDFYARAVEAAADDTRVVVDTSPPALGPALDAGVFLVKPNVRELAELTGRKLKGRSQIEEVAGGLVDEGKAEIIVTSLGPGGSVVVTPEMRERVPAPPVKVESKVGAGDSMVAGIVLALDRGHTVMQSVRYGTAAGAAAVMSAETGLGSREHIERLCDELTAESE